MIIKPATPRQHRRLKDAIEYLREARKCLADAECPLSLKKVRSALKSAEGAERHMRHRRRRTMEGANV
jgi:hypothetical protein